MQEERLVHSLACQIVRPMEYKDFLKKNIDFSLRDVRKPEQELSNLSFFGLGWPRAILKTHSKTSYKKHHLRNWPQIEMSRSDQGTIIRSALTAATAEKEISIVENMAICLTSLVAIFC